MNRTVFKRNTLITVVASILLASQMASAQTVTRNVPIDENGDGRTTITFEPGSNYFPTNHGMKISDGALKPFGAEFAQSAYARGVISSLTVQGCGAQFIAASDTRCYISSGDRDSHAAFLDNDKMRLVFDPPIAALSLRAASPQKTDAMAVYLSLLDQNGDVLGEALPEIKVYQTKTEKQDTSTYFDQLLNSDRKRYVEENANPDNFWVRVAAGDPNASANLVYAAEIEFDHHGNDTAGGLIDTIELTRIVDENGNVIIGAPQIAASFTSVLAQEAANTRRAPPQILASDNAEDSRSSAWAFPPAQRVRLTPDWDSARRAQSAFNDAGIAPQYTVSDTQILAIDVPLLLPIEADASPIIMAEEDFYHAVVKRSDGAFSIHGSRLASLETSSGDAGDFEPGRINYALTETGWAADFEFFGIPYLVMFNCDMASSACVDGSLIRQEIEQLVPVLGSRGE